MLSNREIRSRSLRMNADVIDLKCFTWLSFNYRGVLNRFSFLPPFLSEKGNLFQVIPFLKSKRHSISVVYIGLPLIDLIHNT